MLVYGLLSLAIIVFVIGSFSLGCYLGWKARQVSYSPKLYKVPFRSERTAAVAERVAEETTLADQMAQAYLSGFRMTRDDYLNGHAPLKPVIPQDIKNGTMEEING